MRVFKLFRWAAAFTLAMALAPALPSTRADTVTDWNKIMQDTVTASGGTPASNPNHQTRWGAIVQLAVFEAVNSIDRSYEPYIAYLRRPMPRSTPRSSPLLMTPWSSCARLAPRR